MRFNLAEKLAQVKTKLTWWTKTISPIFFKFCVIFRFTWKWIETTKKNLFYPGTEGNWSNLRPFLSAKNPKIIIF